MPNRRPGDHPLTDIISMPPSLSRIADELVREIVDLGGREQIADMLLNK